MEEECCPCEDDADKGLPGKHADAGTHAGTVADADKGTHADAGTHTEPVADADAGTDAGVGTGGLS